jgi:hypothetical protein
MFFIFQKFNVGWLLHRTSQTSNNKCVFTQNSVKKKVSSPFFHARHDFSWKKARMDLFLNQKSLQHDPSSKGRLSPSSDPCLMVHQARASASMDFWNWLSIAICSMLNQLTI